MKEKLNLKSDIEVLLRKTTKDEVKKISLRQLRRLMKEVDDVVLPEDARVYDRLHARIMAEVPVDFSPQVASTALETDEAYACSALNLGDEARDDRRKLISWGGLWRRFSAE